MPHWKSMMDARWMFAFNLNGRDCTLTIANVTGGEVTGEGNKKSKKPLCTWRERARNGDEIKPLILNVTNCKIIAAMYGNDTAEWAGKRITLYPTTTSVGGNVVDCIRVRPRVPSAKKKGDADDPLPNNDDPTPQQDPQPAEAPQREPGEDDL